MGFREHLEEICARVDGSLLCSVMGYDGIAVETVEQRPDGLDVAALLVEYTQVVNQVRQAASVLQSGKIEELVVSTDKLTAFSRPLTADYFLVLALGPDGNWGKARFVMRTTAPKVQAEF